MTDHPLTDGIIEEIAQFEPDLTDPFILNRIHDMQTAADWQLEQVIEYFKSEILEAKCGFIVLNDERLLQFEKAMRPQQ